MQTLPLPVICWPAALPKAVLPLPVLLLKSANDPVAVLAAPAVLSWSA